MANVNINTTNDIISVIQENTNVIQVVTSGPQGLQGPVGPSGSTGPQGPSGSAQGVGVEVFNAYTSSANTAISLKAPVIDPTFTNNITVNGQAKINMLVNFAAAVSAPAQQTSSLFSFPANTYRAVILDVHAQNNVSSSVYSMSTVTVLYEPNQPNNVVINKAETLQSSLTNQIFEKVDYIGYYDGTYNLIRIVNNLPDNHTFRFLARGIPNN